MSEERITYDVIGTFYGLTGRQRKIQFQLLTVENLDEKPTDEYAEELIRKELVSSNARKVTHNQVGIEIRECKTDGVFKSYELFGLNNRKFNIEFE